MDIDEIRESRTPEPARSDELEPVQRTRLLPIRSRESSYEDFYRWHVHDRVTISKEARRRYRKMAAESKREEAG